jgi:regulatory protein RepA
LTADGVTMPSVFFKEDDLPQRKIIPYPRPEPIGLAEWHTARIQPVCIVENWFYEDVGVIGGAGGTGKTTLILFQGIHIALGRELFGYEVEMSGPVIFLTAEDSREILIARLRLMAVELELTEEEIEQVRKFILIVDASAESLKLTVMKRNIQVSAAVARLALTFHPLAPSILFIDPAVSFGVGESQVNDAEQGLIEAGRILKSFIGCAVIFIHHTGKQNGRDKTVDQYSLRGGSAFSDGSRMVHILAPLNSKEWREATGDELLDGEAGLLYARPKMSHVSPQPWVYLKRNGYIFTRYDGVQSKKTALVANAEYLLNLIRAEVAAGGFPTGRSIDLMGLNLSQAAIRLAINLLKSEGKIIDTPRKSAGHGGARSYLRPVEVEE